MKKYPKYKESGIQWLGKVPEHWEVCKVKHLQDRTAHDAFLDGDWIESPYITEEGIRYITSGNIGDGFFKRQGNGHITDETYQKLNCLSVYPGDLIFCRLNAPFGRSCILPNDEDRYVMAVDNVVLRTKENKHYLCYVTQCPRYHQHVEECASGMAMQRISRSDLGNISVPLPPLSEQQAIAEYLDKKTAKIDESVAALEAQKADLQKYRAAVISKAVTRGLNAATKMKDSGVEWIGQIPEGWEIIKLGWLFGVIGSGTTPKSDFAGFYATEGCHWLQTGDLTDGLVFATSKFVTELARSQHSLPIYPKHSIVIAMYGATIGKLGILNIEACTNQACCVLANCAGIEYKFAYYSLLAGRKELVNSANGGGQPNISQAIIREFRIPVPPLSEQQAIVEYLDKKTAKIDEAIATIDTQITDLRAYRTALITEVVTGKVKVSCGE